MTIKKFAEQISLEDSLAGDFAYDILRDSKFPYKESHKEQLRYLKWVAEWNKVVESYNEFMDRYKKMK